MSLFEKLKNTIKSIATPKSKTKSTKSLKAVMQAVDFNVFRFRKKTGVTIVGKRGGKDDQRQLQDCTIVDLPNNYKLYSINIPQFLSKINGDYPEIKEGPNGSKQQANIRGSKNFDIKELPPEIISDLGIKFNSNGESNASSKKEGYAAWILNGKTLMPLKRQQLNSITLKGSQSKKMLWRETRGGSLEESFIKQVGLLVMSLVKDEKGNALINEDISPASYTPARENSDGQGEGINLSLGDEELFSDNETDLFAEAEASIEKITIDQVSQLNLKSLMKSFGDDFEDEADFGEQLAFNLNEIAETFSKSLKKEAKFQEYSKKDFFTDGLEIGEATSNHKIAIKLRRPKAIDEPPLACTLTFRDFDLKSYFIIKDVNEMNSTILERLLKFKDKIFLNLDSYEKREVEKKEERIKAQIIENERLEEIKKRKIVKERETAILDAIKVEIKEMTDNFINKMRGSTKSLKSLLDDGFTEEEAKIKIDLILNGLRKDLEESIESITDIKEMKKMKETIRKGYIKDLKEHGLGAL